MSFKTANEIWFTIYRMVQADIPRARNRDRINSLMVGEPPFTEAEAIDGKIFTNVNFLEARRALSTAQLQARQAFLKPPMYFDWSLDTGPKAKRMQWGNTLSFHANKLLKGDNRYTGVRKSQVDSSVLHGIGPAVWVKKQDWRPQTRGIEDILVPSLTLRDKSNLDYFAVFTTWTLSQLEKMTTGPNVDKGWNMPLVAALIKAMRRDLGSSSTSAYNNHWQYPEKIGQDIVENSAYIGVDAAPRIRAYDFYFKEEIAGKEVWLRRILLDRVNEPYAGITVTNNGADSQEFLFNPGNRSYASCINELLHCQFADCNCVVPYRWHNVRSLGYLLYVVGHFQNRIRCKSMDAFFESLSMYFKNVPAGDKERLQSIDLYNYCAIPDGIEIVPQQERNQVNFQNVANFLQSNRQLIMEMSSVWNSEAQATGGGQQPTATQIVADATNRNALVSATISDAMDDAEVQYYELARRLATLDNDDCKRFRRKCEEDGVDPAIWKEPSAWIIRAQRSIGGGNKAIEMAMVNSLETIAPRLSPQGQRIVDKLFIVANSDNPDLADLLIPDEQQPPSATVQTACLAWATLMDIEPVALTDAIDHKEYAATLLAKLVVAVQKTSVAAQAGQMPDMHTLAGYDFVSQTILNEVKLVAADKSAGDWVKKADTLLAQVNNEIKALSQRLQEAMKAAAAQQPQQNPVDQAKVAKLQAETQRVVAEGQQTLAQRAQLHQLTVQERQTEHALDNAHKVQEMHQDTQEHQAGLALDAAKTANDMAIKRGSAKQAAAESQPQ